MTRQLIINFHGIGQPDDTIDRGERSFWIDENAMCQILDQIVVVKNRMPGQDKESPEILITFDDGNLSDLTVALPALVKRNLTATFFVCVGRMNDPRYLSRTHIAELIACGMKIGNHGMFQKNLMMLSDSELEAEVETARMMLQDITGTPVTEFAIPYGAYNRRVMKWLKSRKLGCIYTSDRGFARSNALIKPRESVTAHMAHAMIPDVMLMPGSLRLVIRRKISVTYKSWR